MIIEFAGLPGSGKTTLYQRGVEQFGLHGVPLIVPVVAPSIVGGVDTPHVPQLSGRLGHYPTGLAIRAWFLVPRVLRRIAASFASPRAVILALQQILFSRRPVSDKLYGMRLFLAALGNRWLVRRCGQSNQVAMFDEGVVQRCFTVFVDGLSEVNPAAIARYAQIVPIPDVLVYLKASPEVVLKRLGNRSRGLPGRFQNLDSTSLKLALADAGRGLDTLVEGIRGCAKTPVTVVVIDADDLETAKAEFDSRVIGGILDNYKLRPTGKLIC